MNNSITPEPPVQRIQLSQTAKEQLAKLKRVTKINQWNILCRWALCRSLAEQHPLADVLTLTDSNVEMSWHTFGCNIAEILLVALTQWRIEQNLPTDRETLANPLRLHLHRGIGYLAGDPKDQNHRRLRPVKLKRRSPH